MYDFQFSKDEVALLSQVLFTDKFSFTGNIAKTVVSLQQKLQPTIDTLIAEAKKEEQTPAK